MRSYLIVLTAMLIGCIGVNRNVGYPPKKSDNVSASSSASTVAAASSSNTASINSPTGVGQVKPDRNYLDFYLNGDVF